MNDDRKEFLINMYNQMFNDINRHIMVVWQSVAVLVGAFAIFSLVEKNIISLDVAVSLIVLLAGWLVAHLLDAAYWYNRNLVIIANIERQFLERDDLKLICYYFGAHRPKNKMIAHLKIQVALALGLAAVVLILHFFKQVSPGFSAPWSNLEVIRFLPYAMTLAAYLYVRSIDKARDDDYAEFLRESPGKKVDAMGTEFGPGHGHPRQAG
jgi:hypothetical protein